MKTCAYAMLAAVLCGLSACASKPADDQSALLQKAVYVVGDGAPMQDKMPDQMQNQAVSDTPQSAGGSGPVLKLQHLYWYLSGR